MNLFSWGFYYLLENKNEKLEIYLIPRLFSEKNILDLFERRLEKLSALYQLIENNYSLLK